MITKGGTEPHGPYSAKVDSFIDAVNHAPCGYRKSVVHNRTVSSEGRDCSGTLSKTSLRNEVLYYKDDESYQHSAAQTATLETQCDGLRTPRHSIACVSLQLFQHCTIIFDSKMHLCTQKD